MALVNSPNGSSPMTPINTPYGPFFTTLRKILNAHRPLPAPWVKTITIWGSDYLSPYDDDARFTMTTIETSFRDLQLYLAGFLFEENRPPALKLYHARFDRVDHSEVVRTRCPICFDDFEEKFDPHGIPIKTLCNKANHIFHSKCITAWMRQSHGREACPTCRTTFRSAIQRVGRVVIQERGERDPRTSFKNQVFIIANPDVRPDQVLRTFIAQYDYHAREEARSRNMVLPTIANAPKHVVPFMLGRLIESDVVHLVEPDAVNENGQQVDLVNESENGFDDQEDGGDGEVEAHTIGLGDVADQALVVSFARIRARLARLEEFAASLGGTITWPADEDEVTDIDEILNRFADRVAKIEETIARAMQQDDAASMTL